MQEYRPRALRRAGRAAAAGLFCNAAADSIYVGVGVCIGLRLKFRRSKKLN